MVFHTQFLQGFGVLGRQGDAADLDVDGLIEEVQEARRIKLLHQPSKVMVMEYELRALHQLPLHHHLPLVPPLALGGSISRGLGVYL
ncbi:stomatal closure-related actin-binding protein 1 isoform X2 [Cajanus cajan]|uniref:stomatal closure-related actin-binding protein 1 isoform X2 n=1 Tax=Cajanus cajan TaxID=3821 RepID=UPI0010FB0588|nr:stomatal closure-related actin-binding protein 1 isoform X2 [Cajanus cajan]